MCNFANIQLNDEEEISDLSDMEVNDNDEDETTDDEQTHEIENYLSVIFTRLCDDHVIPIEMFNVPEFRMWIRSLIAIGAICGQDRLKELLEDC